MADKGNLVVGQSGGPTAVINRSVVGVIHEALKHKAIGKILGAHNGIKGILQEDFIDLRALSKDTLARMMEAPGAALGSCRFKPSQEDCEKVFEVFRKHNVHYFFYIGGNDSALAASIVNEIARARKFELRIFHIPKTIDNDLLVTDHCPGFGSAGRYVAQAFLGNDLDNIALPGIKIDIIMGRQAGWLTTTAAMAAEQEGDGPHLLYFPERPKRLIDLITDIEAVYKKYGRALVGISEGILGPDGQEYVQSNAIRAEVEQLAGKVFVEWLDKFGEVMDAAGGAKKDAFGHIQLSGTGILADFISMAVKAVLNPRFGNKLRVRADTLGYAQRSFAGCVSETDAREAYEVGREAVRYAMRGNIDGSVVIKRLGSGENYAVEYNCVKLSKVAAGTKDVPAKFFNKAGNGVTQACKNYLAPLIGPLPKRPRL
ncbi:MAG: 6-phosphofructokinase [Candidatus Sumerlaeia bacterium]|nr:6-phosphofructokinase [Candidatus Sumerlaeia bacterium]